MILCGTRDEHPNQILPVAETWGDEECNIEVWQLGYYARYSSLWQGSPG